MSSRKAKKEALRAERLRREQEERAAERRRKLLVNVAAVAIAAPVVAFVAIAIGGGLFEGGGERGSFAEGSVPERRITELKPAAEAAGCTVRDQRSEGNGHMTDPVQYGTSPPTSGSHHPMPADDGAYTDSPGTSKLVHSLEHGRVIIWFDPEAPADVKGDLKALFDEDPAHMILTAGEARMPYQVAASAWTHLLGCKRYNARVPDAIRAFRDRYRNRGPEQVP